MQVEHKTQKGTVLFVKVPDDASDLTLPKVGMIDLYFQTKVKSEYEEDNYISVGLPDLGFQLIGLTSEVTEKQAKMIVPLIERVYGQSYYDYTVKFKVGYGYVGTALESLKSLMQHLQVYEVNPYSHFTNPEDFDNDAIEHAQELSNFVGKWVVLFKEN